MKQFRGLIPIALDISENDIKLCIKKHRKLYPNDKRTDDEIRPFVINTLLQH